MGARLDEHTLVYLRTDKHAPTIGPEERKRVLKRATRYVWHPPQLSAMEGRPLRLPRLLRQVGDGSTRVAPAPGDREAVVVQTDTREVWPLGAAPN